MQDNGLLDLLMHFENVYIHWLNIIFVFEQYTMCIHTISAHWGLRLKLEKTVRTTGVVKLHFKMTTNWFFLRGGWWRAFNNNNFHVEINFYNLNSNSLRPPRIRTLIDWMFCKNEITKINKCYGCLT